MGLRSLRVSFDLDVQHAQFFSICLASLEQTFFQHFDLWTSRRRIFSCPNFYAYHYDSYSVLRNFCFIWIILKVSDDTEGKRKSATIDHRKTWAWWKLPWPSQLSPWLRPLLLNLLFYVFLTHGGFNNDSKLWLLLGNDFGMRNSVLFGHFHMETISLVN